MLLIVDDDPKFLQDAERALDHRGGGVYLAGSAEHAMELLVAVGQAFHLALIDVDLPGRDGLALIRDLRQRCPDLPTIAITGSVPDPRLETARALGAVDALRKPITVEWTRAIDRAQRGAAVA
jgi:CheY-like chemotaxis protein